MNFSVGLRAAWAFVIFLMPIDTKSATRDVGAPPSKFAICLEFDRRQVNAQDRVFWSAEHVALRETASYQRWFTVSGEQKAIGVLTPPWRLESLRKAKENAIDEMKSLPIFDALLKTENCVVIQAVRREEIEQQCRVTEAEIPCVDLPDLARLTPTHS